MEQENTAALTVHVDTAELAQKFATLSKAAKKMSNALAALETTECPVSIRTQRESELENRISDTECPPF